jgi:serine/threonine protein kinase
MNHYFARNIIHRDIKPENMMIGNDGRVRICDFGLATKIREGCELIEAMGTMTYMAPEVLLGKYG